MLGEDTTPALLRSAIDAMRRVDPEPPVVVLGGDFVAHIFDPKQAVPTMRALAQEFNHAFPHAQFVLVLGNEDSSCGDYQVSPNSPFLRAVAQAWEPLVNRNGAAPGFAHTFPAYGSYVTRLPSPGLRAIVLDDVFWSPRYRNACGPAAQPAAATLHALTTALRADAHASTTWLFVHIPPGIDAYSTAHLAHGLIVVPFLDQQPRDAFVTAVTGGPRPVALIVAAHTHKFSFRVAGSGAHTVPILLVPSISPVFRNAPSFLTVHLDAHGTIVAADDWTRLDGSWGRRGGIASLGMRDVSGASILDLSHRLTGDAHLRELYARLYNGGERPEISDANWRTYACAATELSATAFRACMAEGGFSIFTTRGIVAASGFFIVVLVAATALVLRRRVA
jgi:hypothetical protein